VTFCPQSVSVTGFTGAAGGNRRPAAAAGMSAALTANELRSNAVANSPSALRIPQFYGGGPRTDKAAFGIALRSGFDVGKLEVASTSLRSRRPRGFL
jgi:hypothetical protein